MLAGVVFWIMVIYFVGSYIVITDACGGWEGSMLP